MLFSHCPITMACARSTALFTLVLLLPVPLTTAAVAPGADYRRPAPSPGHKCGAQGTYAPGSAYEANLRLLAANIPGNANGSSCRCSVLPRQPRRPTPRQRRRFGLLLLASGRRLVVRLRRLHRAGLRGGTAAVPVPQAGHGRG